MYSSNLLGRNVWIKYSKHIYRVDKGIFLPR